VPEEVEAKLRERP